ncbi:NAD-dependent epimerase/dehydratase family protein [Novilysobacter arseniciresistens]|uniref:NAD-dependent epimerase/dehydratase family protein n=1 Tax=Novilysobacter arseniciresistens TaxID=1385522 RepID=UPI000689D618|nr:NAD-dependent epimerase/dehydratase family protein [Lysobacter arseniciresistens]
MRHALVFGGSGQVGRPLLARLCGAGWRVSAVSRAPAADAGAGALRWLAGEFDAMPALPSQVDAILSCGPLDRFARWYAAAAPECPRVVAFGSTSIDTKHDSADAGERDIVRRLREGEAAVFAAAAGRGAAATLLRPTLVYGAGRDASLSRIAALAGRAGVFALPRGATGLRQPVHVEDLADAAMACLGAPASHGRAYALPGGETLPYREMVGRVLACLQPPARLVELPAPLFAIALRLAQLTGRARGLGDAAIGRMREDLVFDIDPAARDLGYAPRPFRPSPGMFMPSGPVR